MDPAPPPAVVPTTASTETTPPEAPGDSPSGDGVALCPNCDAPRVGAYCPGCGQRQTMDRLTLTGLWRDFASRVFNVNRGLLATIVEMTKHPGQVPLDYVEGRRRRYTNPLTYLFLASALSVFLLQFSDDLVMEQMREQIARQEAAREAAAPEADDLAATTGVPHDHDGDGVADHEADPRIDRFRENLEVLMADGAAGYVERTMETMRRYQSLLMLFLCLPFTLLLRLLFGPKRNLAETSVFSLYVVAHIIFLLAFITPVLLRLGPIITLAGTLGYVVLAAWAAVRFWGEGWSAAARSAIAMTLSLVAYTGFVAVLAFVSVFGQVLAESGASWGWLLGRLLS